MLIRIQNLADSVEGRELTDKDPQIGLFEYWMRIWIRFCYLAANNSEKSLPQKLFPSSRKVIRDVHPRSGFFFISDPESTGQKAQDSRSGSATLIIIYQYFTEINKYGYLSVVLAGEGSLCIARKALQQLNVGLLALRLLAAHSLQGLPRAHRVTQQHAAPRNPAPPAQHSSQ
jgi:hypothetical protein